MANTSRAFKFSNTEHLQVSPWKGNVVWCLFTNGAVMKFSGSTSSPRGCASTQGVMHQVWCTPHNNLRMGTPVLGQPRRLAIPEKRGRNCEKETFLIGEILVATLSSVRSEVLP